jgi:adenylate cyclase
MLRLERAIGFDPENAMAYSLGCLMLRVLGQHDRAIEWAKRSMELDPNDYLTQYSIACFFLQTGETERALDVLENCMPHLGHAQLTWMLRDPDLDSARDHPRYRALVQQEEERWKRITS